MDERLYCEWENGSYVNSLLGGDRFLEDLMELVREYGPPIKVEIRTDWASMVSTAAQVTG
jgi:hypothetical protein